MMIFVFSEDQTLMVLDNIDDVRRECEGIDVEDNVFHFFDENGLELVPEFTVPNKKGKILGLIRWVKSGIFELRRSDKNDPSAIFKALEKTSGLETNDFFNSLDAVREFLTNQRRPIKNPQAAF